ncbi:sensor histidine kinase [Desertivirga xinjiangensis]|uniref:sensor histidine kinase n=1 Tax=Desertivirga xinjiangensis TaxID=539206 RepID=UPI00210AA8D6|nr:ATP-binding protein [Pedobacter xinjiangensis]
MHEIKELEQVYKQELLKSELEIKDQTMNNLASEIHDHIGQMLSLIKLNLSLNPAPGLSETKELVSQVIKDVRNLAHSMHTDGLSNKSIHTLIETEADRLRKTKHFAIYFESKGKIFALDNQTEIFLYRIFQECINNTMKHAHAKNIFIELNYSLPLLSIKISDDGQGFQSHSVEEGLGIRSIKHRANLIGAKLHISSEPGVGTSTYLEVDKSNQIFHGD